MLTIIEAQNELKIAVQLNSGKWEQHSISVAENARLIAEKIDYLDSDKAYVMGLLHDIGRRAGITGIKHIFDGYDYMMSLGEKEVAQICLTHSFPLKNISTFSGKYDCSDEQLNFLQDFLKSVEYNDYDILIQLCDAISLPDGACIMEKRFVDVAIRNGITEHTIDKWKAFIRAKKHFDKLCGCDIYSLLPNVLENSTIDLF